MAHKIRKTAVHVMLLDGDASGIYEVGITGNESLVYKIPRSQLCRCKELGVKDNNSVYFLFGYTQASDRPAVYIGQAGVRKTGGAILTRLGEHDKQKDFWTEAVVFTNNNDNFDAAVLNYLENRFRNMAVEAGRYDVQNGNDPNPGHITKIREAELESYVDDAEMFLQILGYQLFVPTAKLVNPISADHEEKPSVSSTVKVSKPELPLEITAVGEFIRTAIENLQNAGFEFSDEQIQQLTNIEYCKKVFHLQSGDKVTFFKLYNPEEENPHIVDGVNRYYTPKATKNKPGNIFHFGKYNVLLTKELFDKYNHRQYFTDWYNSL